MKYLSPLSTVNETSVSSEVHLVRSCRLQRLKFSLLHGSITISDYMNSVDMNCFFCLSVQSRYSGTLDHTNTVKAMVFEVERSI